MTIVDTIYSYLPAKRKNTPSGWTKFNAVCCSHTGNTNDTRQRGGIIKNGNGVSYHCFNCGFKSSYQAGRHLTHKMKQLLGWLGAPDDVVSKIALEALKIEEDEQVLEAISLPKFDDKPLPADSIRLTENTVSTETASAFEYIYSRGFTVDTYPFHWSPEMPDRVIIPFMFESRTVGYTGRKLSDGRPKYLNEQTPGYVFNLDNQTRDRKYVIVVEGPMDALSIDGVATLGADIMDKQAMLINRLDKQVIVVPDRDREGQRTVERAIELGWAVSMPDWPDGVKDVNDATLKFGKLAVLIAVIANAEANTLKIQLRMRKWFSTILKN
jgi:hypothetical protein